jgi:hypothetical protein
VRAAEALLNRGWGRPAQRVGGIEGGEPIQIYLKNFVLSEGDDPPMDDAEWQASDEPAVRIRQSAVAAASDRRGRASIAVYLLCQLLLPEDRARSLTLADWVGRAAIEVRPLHQLLSA